jgi:hypothetical protein
VFAAPFPRRGTLFSRFVVVEGTGFDRADLSRVRLSGANFVSSSLEDASLAKAEMEFALMAKAVLQSACLGEVPFPSVNACARPRERPSEIKDRGRPIGSSGGRSSG